MVMETQQSDVITDQPQPIEEINFQSIDEIKTYKSWSIINILFCCMCFGAFALYYSYKTEKFKRQRQTQDAINSSKMAQNINFVATIAGVLLIIIYVTNLVIAHK